MNELITVYIADDHQLVIDGLFLLLKSDHHFHVVGSSTDGQIAYTDILALKPMVALIDYRMPGMDGIQLIRSLRKEIETKFILLTMHADHQLVKQSIHAGAHAFLNKNIDRVNLFQTIELVSKGKKNFPQTYDTMEAKLTSREIEMLRLIIHEKSIAEIAELLSLSEHTVKTHRKNIFRKLNSTKISDLTRYALDHQITI